MMKGRKLFSIPMTIILLIGAALAQEPAAAKKAGKPQAQSVAAAPTSSTVNGSGTTGKITKWMSTTTLGDSGIFEDKFGKIGIGTITPTSKLTIQGMVETTLGGIKFPDGTIQTTSAVSGLQSISHDFTLKGNGTSSSPLGVNVPLDLMGNHVGIFSATTTSDSPFATAIFGLGDVGVSGSGKTWGVLGRSTNGIAVRGVTGGFSSNGIGVFGRSEFKDGYAGYFEGYVKITDNGETDPARLNPGNLVVTGLIAKGGGSFKIDHPLDPENKYLYHSFVESPDMKNIYDGVVQLDGNGEAVVELPDWFQALNRDYRYLLAAIGAPAPGLYIAEKVNNNRFKIAGGLGGMEVSWQVTGTRQDAFANKNRIPVEESKTKEERGYYLHPTEHGQPAEKNVERAPESERMKEAREKAQKEKLP